VPADEPRQFTPRYRPARLEAPDVLPRYTALPGDPPVLRRWLAAEAEARGESLPDGEWPQEPRR
jgi:hypothetical protein